MASEAPPEPRTRLRKLVIRKCRNVRPTTLEFDDDWNVLLGKNGSGKTTLLRLLQSLVPRGPEDWDIRDHDVELTFARGDVEVVAQSKVESRASDPLRSGAPTSQIVELVVTRAGFEVGRVSKLGNQLRVQDAQGRVEKGQAGLSSIASIAELLTMTGPDERFFSGYGLRRFDEALASFDELSVRATVEAVIFSVVADGRSTPASFLDRPWTGVAGLAVDATHADSLGDRLELTRGNSVSLDRACELMGFAGARLEYTLHSRDEHAIVYRVSRLEFHGPNGSVTPHEHLSFGQKRLVAFLFHLEAHREVVLADELTNGLHYDWIVQCTDWMADRQKFIAVQNPLMVDRIVFSSAESVRRRFIRCDREGGELVFRSFSEAEADEFFATYQAGAQLVSELLRDQGLW